MAEAIIWGVCGFGFYVTTCLVALRLCRRQTPTALVIGLAPAGGIVSCIIGLIFDETLKFWGVFATYCFLTICFLMAFGAVYKSISIRMLAELNASHGGRMTMSQLLDGYVQGDSFPHRIQILYDHGFVSPGESALHLTPKGATFARRIMKVQRVFGITESG